MFSRSFCQALKVAHNLGITVVLKDSRDMGYWLGKKEIYINPKKASAYVVLHEIGHYLNGYMCCKEHCEYAAHGAAVALAKIHNIKLTKNQLEDIDAYAGCSSHKACGAINP